MPNDNANPWHKVHVVIITISVVVSALFVLFKDRLGVEGEGATQAQRIVGLEEAQRAMRTEIVENYVRKEELRVIDERIIQLQRQVDTMNRLLVEYVQQNR